MVDAEDGGGRDASPHKDSLRALGPKIVTKAQAA